MSYVRIMLAALSGTVAYFIVGFSAFALFPLKTEFMKYSNIYRSEQEMKSVMPLGMLGILFSITVLAVIYASLDRHASTWVDGLRFGALVGLFSAGAFVLHNYVNLRIGLNLTMQQMVVYFAEWLIVGLVIGIVYGSPQPVAH